MRVFHRRFRRAFGRRRPRPGGFPIRRREWFVLAAVCLSAWLVAVLSWRTPSVGPGGPGGADGLAALASAPDVAARVRRPDYEREAFGASWADGVDVAGGGNGCDTRNDVLARDLREVTRGSVASCPAAILGGVLWDPYTGDAVRYRRGPTTGREVQIDHLVPLAYAWDMGAWGWPPGRRAAFANDPANLLAVSGPVNEAKGDQPPAVWMPPRRGFWCRYASQFAVVCAAYGLAIDAASRAVLSKVLARC